jgi:integrase
MRKNWSLTPEQKIDAREAYSLLGDSGMTLTSAVQIALHMNGGVSQKTPLQDAVTQFLHERREKLRGKTLEFYQQHLWAVCAIFEGCTMDEVTAQKVSAHLESLTPSMASARFRSIRALWRWAMKRPTPFVRQDVTATLSFRQPFNRGDIQFLTVDETRAIMTGCETYRHSLALMLFAGIRPEEVRSLHKSPLMWECIDRKAKIVRIPAGVSKTRQPRILEKLPGNLWAWLADAPKSGPVCNASNIRTVVVQAQVAAGYRDEDHSLQRKWPQDAMRHSFATYHVAMFADPGRTALLLGHEGSPSMLYRHYRGLTTKDNAEDYFNIVP